MKTFFQQALDLFLALNRLRPYVRPCQRLMTFVLITSVLAAALETAGVALLIPLLEMLRNPVAKDNSAAVIEVRYDGPSTALELRTNLTNSLPGFAKTGENRRVVLPAEEAKTQLAFPGGSGSIEIIRTSGSGAVEAEIRPEVPGDQSPRAIGSEPVALPPGAGRAVFVLPPPYQALPPRSSRVSRALKRLFPSVDVLSNVFVLCGLVILMVAAKSVFAYLNQRAAYAIRRNVGIDIRNKLYRRLQSVDLEVFEKNTAGEAANVLMLETGRTIYATEFLVLMGQRFMIGAFYMLALVLISWQLTAITGFLALISGATVAYLFRRQSRSGQRAAELNKALGNRMSETFAGIRVIRTTNSQDREIDRYEALNYEGAVLDEKSGNTNALVLPMTETIGVIGGMIIVGFAYQFLVAPGLMRAEMLLGFALILLRLLPIVNQLYALHGQMLYLAGGAKAVLQWLELPTYPKQPFGSAELGRLSRGIELQHLRHVYSTGTVAIDDVSLTVRAGETVALVGGSGSGKTTIATLLLRLRRPSGGQILVDGRDYWEISPASWHRSVAVVEQEAFMFHDTIRNNVAYGCPDATPEQIRKAIRMANLEDLIDSLPAGLDTIVGERGAMLSGGQRQRLAIARALVRDPQILILDEATSALDTVSERQVQEALEEARRGRTVIVIAHRFSTIQRADRIVVFGKGRVVEEGSWEKLAQMQGAFSELLNASQT